MHHLSSPRNITRLLSATVIAAAAFASAAIAADTITFSCASRFFLMIKRHPMATNIPLIKIKVVLTKGKMSYHDMLHSPALSL